LAREYGYADGSGVLRVVQRLDAAAADDRRLRKRLNEARESVDLSRVDSAEKPLSAYLRRLFS